jgi:GT2 family glycosyltransferase
VRKATSRSSGGNLVLRCKAEAEQLLGQAMERGSIIRIDPLCSASSAGSGTIVDEARRMGPAEMGGALPGKLGPAAGRRLGELDNIAFVVIGRNEGERLRSCLKSVLALSPSLVYADSASTDGSAELARSLGAIVVEIASPPFTAARGRSEGLAAARREFTGVEFVQFIDGDCLLEPDWPKTAAEFLRANPDAAAVCGRRYEADPDASFYNRFADYEWNTPVGRTNACGGDSMMRIEAIDMAGDFDPSLLASEEPELCSRMCRHGWSIWRLDFAMTEHDAAMFTFGQWWRRTVRSGRGYAQVWLKNGVPARGGAAAQLRSALVWAVGLPATVFAAAALAQRVELVGILPAAYLVQTARVARRTTGDRRFRWRAAALIMIAKFAEVMGAAKYAASMLGGPSRAN